MHNYCDKPNGKLSKMDEKYWQKKGVDFHDLKDANSRFDLFIDEAGNIFRKLKNAADEFAEWVGHTSDYL